MAYCCVRCCQHEGASWIHWLTVHCSWGSGAKEMGRIHRCDPFQNPPGNQIQNRRQQTIVFIQEASQCAQDPTPQGKWSMPPSGMEARGQRGVHGWNLFLQEPLAMPSSPAAWRKRNTAKTMRPLKRSGAQFSLPSPRLTKSGTSAWDS